jgi:hypothetical protein
MSWTHAPDVQVAYAIQSSVSLIRDARIRWKGATRKRLESVPGARPDIEGRFGRQFTHGDQSLSAESGGSPRFERSFHVRRWRPDWMAGAAGFRTSASSIVRDWAYRYREAQRVAVDRCRRTPSRRVHDLPSLVRSGLEEPRVTIDDIRGSGLSAAQSSTTYSLRSQSINSSRSRPTVRAALFGARDKKWLIMPIERPGTFQITPPGFDAATARVR